MPSIIPFLKKMKPGLLGKIVLALLVVGLLPLGLTSYRLVQLNRHAFTSQVLSSHALNARATATRIDDFVALRRALTHAAAQNPSLYLDPQAEAARHLLGDFLEGANRVGAVMASVVNQEGGEVIRAQHREVADLAETLLAQARPAVTRVIPLEGHFWLVLQAAFPEGAGGLKMVFRADPLRAYVQPEEVWEQAHTVLCDAVGDVILASDTKLNGLPDEMLSKALSGKLSGAGKFRFGENQKVLGAFTPLSGQDWYVLSWQPVRIAEMVALNMRTQALQAFLFAILLVAVLAAVAFFYVVRPIRNLVSGQWELMGLRTASGGGDEISQLKDSFDALQRHLNERETLDKVFLGRYQVLEKVGEGAMGTVFRGWDPRLKRPLAIKTIRFDRGGLETMTGDLASQLVHEAITAASLNHTNVVAVYDVEDTPEVAYVAMEFVEGTTLEDYMLCGVKFSPEEVVLLGIEMARGLQAAHARDIIHHDIKPANVLLGWNHSVKLTDFGISQMMSAVSKDTDMIFGTPGYLPPEALIGNGFNKTGDLFALGVVLYQCLLGQMPFQGATARETFVKTIVQVISPPRHLDPEIPEELSLLVLGLLEKDPEKRIQTADEVLRVLERIKPDRSLIFNQPEQFTNEKEYGHEMVSSRFFRTAAVRETVGLRDSLPRR